MALKLFKKICIIGIGRMGNALLQGLLQSGIPKNNLLLIVKNPAKQAKLLAEGFNCELNILQLSGIDIVFISVKPKDCNAVLKVIKNDKRIHHIPVISICAGYSYALYKKTMGENFPIFRINPNIFISITKGNILFCENPTHPELNQKIKTFLEKLGTVYKCDERYIAEFSWESSSLPGVIISELMIRRLKKLPVETIESICAIFLNGFRGFCQYFEKMIIQYNNPIEALEHISNQIVSPQGLNDAALNFLKEKKFFDIYINAIKIYAKKRKLIEKSLEPPNV